MSFYVYILRCIDYSYYVGHTDDIQHRMAQHDSGEIAGYTQGRRPVRLVFAQEFPTREEALSAERRLKGWSRAKKEALIMGNWERLRHLARSGSAGAGVGETKPFDSAQGERMRQATGVKTAGSGNEGFPG